MVVALHHGRRHPTGARVGAGPGPGLRGCVRLRRSRRVRGSTEEAGVPQARSRAGALVSEARPPPRPCALHARRPATSWATRSASAARASATRGCGRCRCGPSRMATPTTASRVSEASLARLAVRLHPLLHRQQRIDTQAGRLHAEVGAAPRAHAARLGPPTCPPPLPPAPRHGSAAHGAAADRSTASPIVPPMVLPAPPCREGVNDPDVDGAPLTGDLAGLLKRQLAARLAGNRAPLQLSTYYEWLGEEPPEGCATEEDKFCFQAGGSGLAAAESRCWCLLLASAVCRFFLMRLASALADPAPHTHNRLPALTASLPAVQARHQRQRARGAGADRGHRGHAGGAVGHLLRPGPLDAGGCWGACGSGFGGSEGLALVVAASTGCTGCGRAAAQAPAGVTGSAAAQACSASGFVPCLPGASLRHLFIRAAISAMRCQAGPRPPGPVRLLDRLQGARRQGGPVGWEGRLAGGWLRAGEWHGQQRRSCLAARPWLLTPCTSSPNSTQPHPRSRQPDRRGKGRRLLPAAAGRRRRLGRCPCCAGAGACRH